MNRKFDFIKPKMIWFSISLLIIILGVVAFFIKGARFGIDFTGGTSIDVVLEKNATVSEVRKVLEKEGFEQLIVQKIETQKGEFIVKTKTLTKDQEATLINVLDKEFGVKEIKGVKTVSPTWGTQITSSALRALLISFAIVLLYISLRLEFKMGVAALIALVHDVLATLSVYILVGREITPATVAAVLTLLGYSLYDTIVVFHRIKENAKTIGKRTYASMANDSIHQVFMRWVNTLVTTLIPIISIFFFGGETLTDFAFALLVGVTSGGYSSLFIAAPLLVLMKEREPYYATLKKKYGQEAA
ncbi:MAG: protein translocase subunit SecF [Actinobacteria bacterium]|nr:protein translocase subunit SecF [Actinomycetota bacterium]